VSLLDTDSGKELLSFPVPAAVRTSFLVGAPLAFSADGHRLLRFEQESRTPTGTGPDGGRPLTQTSLRVTTWDATPLPDAAAAAK